MSITNLNKFRKEKARREKDKRAEENRVRFGRTLDEKKKAKLEEERRLTALEAHKLKKPEGE